MTRSVATAIIAAVLALAVAIAVPIPVSGSRAWRTAPIESSVPPVDGRYASGYVSDIPASYRAPMCAGAKTFRSVAVYARAADSPDRYWSTVDDIRLAVMRGNAFVHDEAARLGVDRFDFKFACHDGQVLVVNAVLSTPSGNDSFETIEADLRALGLRDPYVKYWVWYDGGVASGACGEARRPGDGTLSEDNPANAGGHHAVAYAHTTACGSVASTLLHEATHTMGAVAPDAWGTDRHGHCADGLDVMCASGNLCSAMRYDCGNDTYFDPRPARGEYLYGHWNVAFCVNRFVSRTGCTSQTRNLRASYSGWAITLRWSPPASSGGAPLWIYEIHRRNCSDCPFHVIDTVNGSRTSYSDLGIETATGNRFQYKVRAINVWRDGGPLSNLASAGLW